MKLERDVRIKEQFMNDRTSQVFAFVVKPNQLDAEA
jgi:hypothetical protein